MSSIIRFDGFEVDLASGQVRRNGRRIRLREQCFQVLASLLEHPGGVVTRDDLRRRLWPDDINVDFENGLNRAVTVLREALGDSAEHPRFIETLPKRGYRFIANVSAAAPSPSSGHSGGLRIVVLPFVNSSGDSSQEYFSDAMTDEIITELSALAPAQLAVIARTTAMRYKGTHKDIAKIARELAVDYVAEGSARRQDDHVALTAQLIRASDQSHVFARRYEVDVSGVFDLERAVAQSFGERIGIVPATPGGNDPAARPLIARKPTDDPVAYNYYIQGRYYFERGVLSPASVLKAREFLRQALSCDPHLAPAYETLADLCWYMGFFAVRPPREMLMAGMGAALRAVEIDGNLAGAHSLLAQYRKQLDYNWGEVQREMALALKLDPRSPLVRTRRAVTELMPFARLEEAEADLRLALELDPFSFFPRAWLAAILSFRREYARSIDEGRLLLELEPTHVGAHFAMGMVCNEARVFEEAIAALRKAAELSNNLPLVLGWLGLALGQSGDTAGARALYERLRTLPPDVYVPPTSFAWIHLALGEIDDCFNWMERAIDDRDHMITPIKSYSFLDPIRTDPRYTRLLRKMNMA